VDNSLRARPDRLRPGDRVAVVSPSGPCEPDHLEAGCDRLRAFGLDVVVGPHTLDRVRYLAGSDADRAADLQAAWCDPEVRAVICARGGYGAARLLPLLDWAALAGAGPKLLHGSSDVTALHAAFGTRLGLVTTFGPMPANHLLGGHPPDEESLDHLRRSLMAPETTLTLAGTHALAAGRATGRLTGGNLTLLAASMGTPWAAPPARGALVFLEDVGEAPYRVDRLLTQLLLAGWLDGVAGVVLGAWDGCGDDVEETLVERLAPLAVPILAGLAVGHGRPQLTLPLGVEATVDTDRCEVVVSEPALV
jgi:muramoyltetrapeptide carboxypeptidase